ncbi:MAG: hypothetical protein MRERC_1c059 [Mycoplasmataceae bacterium RC_NB112A]|nr:MAG: hypothetical protein MRERC_1c059 [Mycoplasmataceae bacterium RC_NB112A]
MHFLYSFYKFILGKIKRETFSFLLNKFCIEDF